jgi:hypothetical protein
MSESKPFQIVMDAFVDPAISRPVTTAAGGMAMVDDRDDQQQRFSYFTDRGATNAAVIIVPKKPSKPNLLRLLGEEGDEESRTLDRELDGVMGDLANALYAGLAKTALSSRPSTARSRSSRPPTSSVNRRPLIPAPKAAW